MAQKRKEFDNQDLLKAIADLTQRQGFPPSVRELQQRFGLKSPSTVQLRLNQLMVQGLISWEPGKARSLRIVEDKASACYHQGNGTPHCPHGCDLALVNLIEQAERAAGNLETEGLQEVAGGLREAIKAVKLKLYGGLDGTAN